MVPLAVLLGTFAVATLVSRKRETLGLRGRAALAAMFLVTAIAHFVNPAELVAMLPAWVPGRLALVYGTGAIELVFAVGLLAIRDQRALGWLVVAFLVAVVPANIYSALAESGLGGHGPAYLWFRVPLQLLFVAWTLVFARVGGVRAS